MRRKAKVFLLNVLIYFINIVFFAVIVVVVDVFYFFKIASSVDIQFRHDDISRSLHWPINLMVLFFVLKRQENIFALV